MGFYFSHPPHSPLLRSAKASPALTRARSHNKELRRAASRRAARERGSSAGSRQTSPEANPPVCTELSFSVKKVVGGRRGWKIMADSEDGPDRAALQTVVTMTR